MNKLEELIKELLNSQSVIRYKNLEKIIDSKPTLKVEFQNLLELQKALVQSENATVSDNGLAQNNYDKVMSNLMDNPVISEYLSSLEEVNEDLNMIQSIIENEINEELK